MIKAEFIQLSVEAENWEDAIRKSADPLLKNRKITKEYVEKIIDTTRTTGPYMVVTKHVALPHASANFGALDVAMGITILKNPVVSGNEANDPVKYLFCMSAKDSQTHLDSMAELVELLSNQEFYDVLDHAKNANEILMYIQTKEGEDNYA